MKKIISMFAVLMMIGALCVGCEKTGTATPGAAEQQKKKVEENNAKNWEPETKKEPATKKAAAAPATGGHDPNVGDHTGHNH